MRLPQTRPAARKNAMQRLPFIPRLGQLRDCRARCSLGAWRWEPTIVRKENAASCYEHGRRNWRPSITFPSSGMTALVGKWHCHTGLVIHK